MGFTWKEIASSYGAQLDRLAVQLGRDRVQVQQQILDDYGPGWSWGGDEEDRVLNPVEIGKLFRTAIFGDFWTEMSTTGWLFKLVKPEHRSEILGLENRLASISEFNKIEIDNLGQFAGSVISLLQQCGYITLAKADQLGTMPQFRLVCPNKFVASFAAQSLFEKLLGNVMDARTSASIKAHVASGDLRALFEKDIKGQFAALAYSTSKGRKRLR